MGFSLASQAQNEAVTKIFQELVNKKKDITHEIFIGSFGNGVNRFHINARDVRVKSGYNKESISGLSAQVTKDSSSGNFDIKLTFGFKNGKVASQEATVSYLPDEKYVGQYETSF